MYLHFRGKANRPFVTGFVKLRDAYLIHPIKNAPANAKIDLNFIGKQMLLDVFVPTSKGQNVTVKGKVKIDGSKYNSAKRLFEAYLLFEDIRQKFNERKPDPNDMRVGLYDMKVLGKDNIPLIIRYIQDNINVTKFLPRV